MSRKTSTKRVMSSTVCIRPPTETTLASLCSRARTAVSSLHTSARAHALDLVGRDRLAVAGAADHHAEALLAVLPVGGDGLGRAQAEDRVVVEGVVDERAVVDGLVAVVGEPVEQVLLELEAGVVGAEVDAHGAESVRALVRPCRSRNPATSASASSAASNSCGWRQKPWIMPAYVVSSTVAPAAAIRRASSRSSSASTSCSATWTSVGGRLSEAGRRGRREVGVARGRGRARRTAASTTRASRAGQPAVRARRRTAATRRVDEGVDQHGRGERVRGCAAPRPARGCRRRCRRRPRPAPRSRPRLPALSEQPAQRGVDVVGRGREPVLGRPPVVDGEHRRAGPVGEPAGLAVVGVDVAEHEAAAVQEHARAPRPRTVGDVEPAGHAVGVDVLDPVDRLLAASARRPAERARARLAAMSAAPKPGSATLGPCDHSSSAATACGCRVMRRRRAGPAPRRRRRGRAW